MRVSVLEVYDLELLVDEYLETCEDGKQYEAALDLLEAVEQLLQRGKHGNDTRTTGKGAASPGSSSETGTSQ
jgi:hypothetical protein